MSRWKVALALLVGGATLGCASKPLTYENSASVTSTGRVESLDQGSRLITLRDTAGESRTYYVSRSVKRLDEVKVGDSVNTEYTVSLVGELRPATEAEKADPIQIERTASRASDGRAPSGDVSRKVTIVTTVERVDLPNMMVTLRGPMGDITMVRARSEDNIRKLRVGDTIVLTYVESAEISLVKGSR